MTNSRNYQPPIVLIDESQLLKPRAANPARRLITPSYDVDFSAFTEVTFILSIAEVVGAPTAFSLTPKLQYAQSHTRAGQWTQPRFFDVDEHTISTDVIGGEWFPTITEADGPGSWKRTIHHHPHRLRIDLGESGPDAFTITGGTNPGLRMSLIAYPRS